MGEQRLGAVFAVVLVASVLAGAILHTSPAAAAAGDLAPDFAGVGFRVDSFFADQRTGLARMNGGAQAAAVDASGRLLAIAGGPRRGTVTIVRYLPDGQLDPSFGAGGAAVVRVFAATEDPSDPNDRNPYIVGAYVQADGILVIAGGREGRWGAGAAFVARIDLASAAPDPTFGAGGISAVPGETVVEGLAEDGSGRPVVSGRAYPGDLAFVGRFSTAGELDASFGEGGLSITSLHDAKGNVGGFGPVATVGDEIVAATGLTEAAGGFVVRYLPDGGLDSGFGHNGIARFLPDAPLFVQTAALHPLPDGKLLVLGDLSGPLFLTRLDSNGSVDRGFGFKGTITAKPQAAAARYSEGFSPGGVAVEPDGRIVVAGTINGTAGGCYRAADRLAGPSPGCFPGSSDYLGLARYLPSGAADCSFGHGGVAHYKLAEGIERIQVAGAFVSPLGRLLLAGGEGSGATQGVLAAGVQLGSPPSQRLPASVGPTKVLAATWTGFSLAKLRQGRLRLLLRLRDPLAERCSPSDLAAKLVTPWSKPAVIARARDLVGKSGRGTLRFGLVKEAPKLLRGRKSIRLRVVVTLRHGGGERQPILRELARLG